MKPVIVTWMDAQDHPHKWADAADVDEWADKSCEITSIGFLIKKTDKYLTLAGDFDPTDADYGRVTKIPAGWVISVKELT
jgi:hypothetical protein